MKMKMKMKMKSMTQMQNELLAEARWDGGFPRAVCLFPGVVALAYTEEEYRRLCTQDARAILWALCTLLVAGAGIALMLW